MSKKTNTKLDKLDKEVRRRMKIEDDSLSDKKDLDAKLNSEQILNPMSICDFVTVDIFTPEECEKLIIYCKKKYKLHKATLNKGLTVDESIRNSKTSWLSREDENLFWVYDRIKDVIMTVNEKKYNYDISNSESIQFTEYSCGEHYTWHHDLGEEETTSKRKLSISVELTDRSTYDGGQLMLLTMGNHYNTIKSKIGQAIIFSSFTPHIVTEVTPKSGSS